MIKIDGREYILSPRRASDVLNLIAAAEKNTSPDGISSMLTIAKVVCDSLKATYLSLGKIRGWRYYHFTRSSGVTSILEGLSTAEIGLAYESVMALEGAKKKMNPVESA